MSLISENIYLKTKSFYFCDEPGLVESLGCFMESVVLDCGSLQLCCCAGPFPSCSMCCSHWGGLVVICLGLMLPALHSAPVGPRGGRPPSTTAETHTHKKTYTPTRGLLFIQHTSKAQGPSAITQILFALLSSPSSLLRLYRLFFLMLPRCTVCHNITHILTTTWVNMPLRSTMFFFHNNMEWTLVNLTSGYPVNAAGFGSCRDICLRIM